MESQLPVDAGFICFRASVIVAVLRDAIRRLYSVPIRVTQ